MNWCHRWQHELDIKEWKAHLRRNGICKLFPFGRGQKKGAVAQEQWSTARGICKMWYCEDSYSKKYSNPVQTEVRLTQQLPLTHTHTHTHVCTHTHTNGFTEKVMSVSGRRTICLGCVVFFTPRSTFNKKLQDAFLKAIKNCQEIRQSIGPDQEMSQMLEWSP